MLSQEALGGDSIVAWASVQECPLNGANVSKAWVLRAVGQGLAVGRPARATVLLSRGG